MGFLPLFAMLHLFPLFRLFVISYVYMNHVYTPDRVTTAAALVASLSVLECAFWGFLPLFTLLHLFALSCLSL